MVLLNRAFLYWGFYNLAKEEIKGCWATNEETNKENLEMSFSLQKF